MLDISWTIMASTDPLTGTISRMPILLQFKIVSGRLRNLFLTKAFADHVSTANESVTPEYDHTGGRPGPAPSETMSPTQNCPL